MKPRLVAITLPCRHFFHILLSILFTTLYRCPQALPHHTGKRTTDWKVSARGAYETDGSERGKTRPGTTRWRPAASGRACYPDLEKNKLPGEAVHEPGARWDGCASVLPRKEPDTACIQRGDKHHFRGDHFDLPCIPLGGRSPSVRSGMRRTGGERHSTADNGRARQMRPGQLIAKTFRLFPLRTARKANGPALAVPFINRSHASQSKLEKQIYQSVRFE